jgi:hypothetical protein
MTMEIGKHNGAPLSLEFCKMEASPMLRVQLSNFPDSLSIPAESSYMLKM